MNQFTKLENQISQLSQKLNVNNINNQQELKGKYWRYVGQVVNGLKEGKGSVYFNFIINNYLFQLHHFLLALHVFLLVYHYNNHPFLYYHYYNNKFLFLLFYHI